MPVLARFASSGPRCRIQSRSVHATAVVPAILITANRARALPTVGRRLGRSSMPARHLYGVTSPTDALLFDALVDLVAFSARAANRGRRADPMILVARSRRPKLRLALVVVVVVLVVVAADWFQRNREMGALLRATEASESAMVAYKDGQAAVVSGAQLDALGRLVDVDAVRTAIATAASQGAASVLTTGDDVADVRVVPWHFSIVRARTRYLAHSLAWETYLQHVSDYPSDLDKSTSPIQGTFDSAAKAYRVATPPFALYDARARVAAIYAS